MAWKPHIILVSTKAHFQQTLSNESVTLLTEVFQLIEWWLIITKPVQMSDPFDWGFLLIEVNKRGLDWLTVWFLVSELNLNGFQEQDANNVLFIRPTWWAGIKGYDMSLERVWYEYGERVWRWPPAVTQSMVTVWHEYWVMSMVRVWRKYGMSMVSWWEYDDGRLPLPRTECSRLCYS